MMLIIWTPEAERDREDIWDYIAANNPTAAVELDSCFSEAVNRLSEHPEIGAPGKISGTRELFPHNHYRIVYEVNAADETVWILSLVSTFREWPSV